MADIIPFDYQGQFVRFTAEGWINATDVAKQFGKRPADWLKQEETKQYLAALAEALNCDPESLLKTKRGRFDGGTWLHPKLGVRFAQWLDIRFAVWCDLHIDAVLRGSGNALQEYERAHTALETRKEQASAQGRGLAQWRHQKQPLQKQVEYWREQLQIPLNLEREAA
ncbi:KilA-N domain-containing protein [Cycloclasticus pugetii]|uniref:KilA-N domain-containing protein n=1 Tax=Cycloclasticus pugetii TaxID=34068 RepID=UPI003A8EA96A